MGRLILFLLLCAAAQAQTVSADDVNWARAVLERGATDKNPDVRKEAAIAMTLAGTRDQAARLIDALLEDKDVPVRLAALGSARDLKDRRLVPQLEKMLKDPVPEVVVAAARALYTMDQASGRDVLMGVYGREVKSGSGMISTKMRETLRQLRSPKTAFVFALEQGIGYVPAPGVGEGFQALESLLGDGEFSVRANVLLTLIRENTGETRMLVADALFDKDWSVRAAALQVVAAWDLREFLDRIKPLTEDKKDKVRFRAAAVTLKIASTPPR